MAEVVVERGIRTVAGPGQEKPQHLATEADLVNALAAVKKRSLQVVTARETTLERAVGESLSETEHTHQGLADPGLVPAEFRTTRQDSDEVPTGAGRT
jgi:hypothetical protein